MARFIFIAALCVLLSPEAALASCLPVFSPLLSPISDMLGRDPAAALRMAGSVLATRGSLSPEVRGRLMAMQAEAYGRLSHAEDARRIAQGGLEQSLAPEGEARVELLWVLATNTFRASDLAVLRPEVEQAAATAVDTDKRLCLDLALGSIHRMTGNFGRAAHFLFEAYRRSDGEANALAHAEATRLLARLWADVGNDSAALELNKSVIAFETANGNTFLLAMAHGFRGIYLNNLRRFREALPELELAGAAHRQAAAGASEAYIDKELCRALIGLERWEEARRRCDRARAAFIRLGEAGLPHTALLTAEIDLAENKLADARNRLDALIGERNDPVFLNDFEPFRLRAEVNRRMGDLSMALDDLQQYITRYKRWKDATTERQTLVHSAQFAANLQATRAETLQRTLQAERNAAEADQSRLLVSVIALALVLIIVFRMHYLDIRHRRRLVEVANTDPLTGLPNRRHILDRATALLAEARGKGEPFSVAMLDLDHFKAINDTYGHLAGDLVLKEIAAAATATLPAKTPMGRWGGEEFLIVFVGHDPEACSAHLARLRLSAAFIKPHPDAKGHVNFSAGIAEDDGLALPVEQIIDQADKALYLAKTSGRGQTCLFRSMPLAKRRT